MCFLMTTRATSVYVGGHGFYVWAVCSELWNPGILDTGLEVKLIIVNAVAVVFTAVLQSCLQ